MGRQRGMRQAHWLGGLVLLVLGGCPGVLWVSPQTPGVGNGGTNTPDAAVVTPGDGGANADAGELPAVCLEPRKAARPVPPVYNGTRSPTHVPLDALAARAVVALSDSGPRDGSCSGTLIAPRVVLTALHCTEGTPGTDFYVLFGPDDSAPLAAIQTSRKREHPNLDLALLELSRAPDGLVDVTPIPIVLEDLTAADIGVMVENAGFGRTQSGRSDGLYFVAEPIDGFEDQGGFVVVNGMGQRGVCFGDSGGPSMRITPAGDARVIGALSWGDESCVGRDRFTRTDLARSWIEEWTGPTPSAGPRPCGNVTAQGVCNPTGTTAQWCDGSVLQVDTCAAGTGCGWDQGVSGWRCIPQGVNACDGVTAYGACDGQALSWCDRGTLRTRPCDVCGERCVLASEAQGYACITSNCGGLSFEGECAGAVAQWCNSAGQREAVDCAASGRSCGYAGETQGYYCLPRECGSVDYRGECNGDTARWCQNGRLRSRDCAAQGEVCRYVDADTGYFCAP